MTALPTILAEAVALIAAVEDARRDRRSRPIAETRPDWWTDGRAHLFAQRPDRSLIFLAPEDVAALIEAFVLPASAQEILEADLRYRRARQLRPRLDLGLAEAADAP